MTINFAVAWLLLTGTPDSGWTSRYAPDVMSWQTAYHASIDPSHIAPCDGCAVAVSDCSLIGDYWLIRPVGADEWTPVIVSDCAGKDALNSMGISWMDEYNILVELSYPLAVEFGAVDGSVEVEVRR